MARTRRYRDPRSTTARGYGWPHQRLQAQLLAAWQPGDPCTRCGRPMWHRWTYNQRGQRIAAIHLGHLDDRSGWRGLEHARCNIAAANRGRRRQPVRATPSRW